MVGPHHICIVYVATAGLQGHLMGSDEQEIVLLIYVIIDVKQNKVGLKRTQILVSRMTTISHQQSRKLLAYVRAVHLSKGNSRVSGL